jgi:Zn finger protein HypA/HybF involved in hydrogenase expression
MTIRIVQQMPPDTLSPTLPAELVNVTATCPHCGVEFAAVAIKHIRFQCPTCRQRYTFEALAGGWTTKK